MKTSQSAIARRFFSTTKELRVFPMVKVFFAKAMVTESTITLQQLIWSGNTHFPFMTTGCQMVADKSLGLCDLGHIYSTLDSHHDCSTSKMADKVASHSNNSWADSANSKRMQLFTLLLFPVIMWSPKAQLSPSHLSTNTNTPQTQPLTHTRTLWTSLSDAPTPCRGLWKRLALGSRG